MAMDTKRQPEMNMTHLEFWPTTVSGTHDPKPKRGRKPKPPQDATKPRSVRLDDARWRRLKELGREWLERVIDAA
jgi:hypothetical protein